MKKIISFILSSLVALYLSMSVAFAAALATETDKFRATIVPRIKLIIFFI